ncbi:uncharacterized protein APUU_21743S [Aspergillus puulaauensis]|uniref:Uncharacterized protein n=1 Tax=Aspergillus puulaauensis TaxID=1220207 RepID=A0A7R8AJM8_9EURO|nr:uncharacterized protein APUU_21743S [Aspergillus puulaauensis]BCS21311.1 hypothetical protein APUU_21743S [Aspergillus puulaauensis]
MENNSDSPGSSSPCPYTHYLTEDTEELPRVGVFDLRSGHSWESQVHHGQVEQQIQLQDGYSRQVEEQIQQQQHALQPQTEHDQSRYSHIFQQIRTEQEQRELIAQNHARLAAAMQGLPYRTKNHQPPMEQQTQHERQQRLRLRLRRRHHRQLAQQVQAQFRQEGIPLKLPQLQTKKVNRDAHPLTERIHPEFHYMTSILSRNLAPLVHCQSGVPHPYFPKSILSFNLLTSAQLDALALHFDQVYPPNQATFHYPRPIKPWLATNGFVRNLGVDTDVKRRRFGRFIGLRGCESPVKENNDGEEESMREQAEKEWENRLRGFRAEKMARSRMLFEVLYGPVLK